MEWTNEHDSIAHKKRKNSINPLLKYSSEHWCYADYKYMNEVFEGDQEILNDINWSDFGFDLKDGKDTTLWIGSKGAYTVCHYDTYGYNLVIQVI